jgi:hypothetical protein
MDVNGHIGYQQPWLAGVTPDGHGRNYLIAAAPP